MRKLKSSIKGLVVSSIAIALTGCVAVYNQGGTSSLKDLKDLGKPTYAFNTSRNKKVNVVRHQMISEAGLSLGARAGLAWQGKNINAALAENGRILDRVFNFHAMLLPHNVMPPVLLEGHHSLNRNNDAMLRISDRTYKIKRQAHFVTAPPNWREYVWQSFKKPEMPPHSMLPKNKKEHKVWDECVTKGWHDGIKQAIEIFESNLARLVEDYRGLIVYRKLLAHGMVTRPYVATTELGVTGNSEELNVNDQVLRIAALPHMRIDSREWNPALSALNLRNIHLYGGGNGKFGENNVDTNKPIIITQHLISKK